MRCPRRLVFIVALISVTTSLSLNSIDSQWEEWKRRYGKSYKSQDEEMERRSIWESRLQLVEEYQNRDDISFRLEMNAFADEVRSRSMQPIKFDTPPPIEDNELSMPLLYAPAEFDWRDKGVVTAVKNQGMIGAVEAYVATECVESFHAIQTGDLYDLSVFETGACCAIPQLPMVKNIFGCIHGIGGLCRNATYRESPSGCNNATCTSVADVTGTKFVPEGREDLLKNALLEVPIMVYVDAGLTSFEMYSSGIYDDPACSPTRLDHALQLVGYGEQGGKQYWICRNSWGSNWGMQGYILIEAGKNRCGIATMPKYPF